MKISEILWRAANQKLAAVKEDWPQKQQFPLNAISEAADSVEKETAARDFFLQFLFGIHTSSETEMNHYHLSQFSIFAGLRFAEAQQMRYDQLMLAHYIALDIEEI